MGGRVLVYVTCNILYAIYGIILYNCIYKTKKKARSDEITKIETSVLLEKNILMFFFLLFIYYYYFICVEFVQSLKYYLYMFKYIMRIYITQSSSLLMKLRALIYHGGLFVQKYFYKQICYLFFYTFILCITFCVVTCFLDI